MLTIARGVAVEVLDWGGSGRPLVLIAGLGNTPHVYDDFAPLFTDSFHVYGVTRRGFGHSTGPPAGDAATLVNDLRAVLDSLRLSRVVLVGHSIGGEELTGFGVAYPERCGALVYLDAASDRSPGEDELTRELAKFDRPAVYRPPLTSSDSASLTAVASYYARNAVRGLPEAEVRAITRFDSVGRYAGRVGYDSISVKYTRRLLDSLPVPDYRRLRCPSLAIYAVPDSAAAYFPWYGALDSAGKRDASLYFRAWIPLLRAAIDQYRSNAPFSEVVEIRNASHWVFLSHPDETANAMRTFLTATDF